MTAPRAELVAAARETIARGSKSFAAASLLFDPATRERAWLLYAWCRRADDLADGQDLGGDLGDQQGAPVRLATIRTRTADALAGRETGDPAFDAFALVARECGITPAMAGDVIAGFALDAAGWRPRSEADLLRYCFHVAGAVGAMMARVMGVPEGDEATLDRACDLGLAFQLINIARDVAEDGAAGRCYLPMEWLAEADIPPGQHMKPEHREALVAMVARVLDLAERHQAAARYGANALPFRQRWAVLAAANIYDAIGRQVRARGSAAWDHRAQTGTLAKLALVAKGLVQALRRAPKPEPMPRWARGELVALARESG